MIADSSHMSVWIEVIADRYWWFGELSDMLKSRGGALPRAAERCGALSGERGVPPLDTSISEGIG